MDHDTRTEPAPAHRPTPRPAAAGGGRRGPGPRSAATVVAVVLLAAACGGGDRAVSAGTSGEDPAPVAGVCAPDHPDCEDTAVTPDDTPISPDEPVTGPTDEPGPEPATPVPDAVDPRPVSAAGYEVTGDGSVLRIHWWAGIPPCTVLDRIDVTETDDAVTVTVWLGSDPAEPDAYCIEIAKRWWAEVTLERPLGTRPVIDGPSGEVLAPVS